MKRKYTICGIGGLILGIMGGIAGTAFSLGADKQRINDTLIQHTSEITTIKTEIQNSILYLTDAVNNLRTDVQVLKALMERMEQDFRSN